MSFFDGVEVYKENVNNFLEIYKWQQNVDIAVT